LRRPIDVSQRAPPGTLKDRFGRPGVPLPSSPRNTPAGADIRRLNRLPAGPTARADQSRWGKNHVGESPGAESIPPPVPRCFQAQGGAPRALREGQLGGDRHRGRAGGRSTKLAGDESRSGRIYALSEGLQGVVGADHQARTAFGGSSCRELGNAGPPGRLGRALGWAVCRRWKRPDSRHAPNLHTASSKWRNGPHVRSGPPPHVGPGRGDPPSIPVVQRTVTTKRAGPRPGKPARKGGRWWRCMRKFADFISNANPLGPTGQNRTKGSQSTQNAPAPGGGKEGKKA